MNFLLMNGIFEITLDEEHNKQLLVKIQVRENCILLSMIWRSKDLERINSEYTLIESRRELESQRQQLRQASQWADHAQRERINLCSELERQNRLHQESHARGCQEIEELRRWCHKEQKLNEYSMQHDQESQTVSQLRDQVKRLQEQLEFIEDSKEFHDPDSSSSSSRSHVPHQSRIASSSTRKLRREF